MNLNQTTLPNQSVWRVTLRWHEFEGEIRAAILRIALVGFFYGIQLFHYLGMVEKTDVDKGFHQQITTLCVAWMLVSLATLVALRQRFFPPALKYVTCLVDVVLTTIGAWLGSGPASPLVCVYFLVIAMAGLRLSLPLIWVISLSAMVGYMSLVASVDPTWLDADHATPPIEQGVTVAAMAATGVTIGQLIRMIRSGAADYAMRLQRIHESVPVEEAKR